MTGSDFARHPYRIVVRYGGTGVGRRWEGGGGGGGIEREGGGTSEGVRERGKEGGIR